MLYQERRRPSTVQQTPALPAASIQWYIGGQNVTDQATPQSPTPDGTKFISSSTLVYTGDDTDHNKSVYCEAVNIERRQPVRSTGKHIFIQCRYTGHVNISLVLTVKCKYI